MKLISLIFTLFVLTGCGILDKRTLTTEVVTVKVPVVYSPKPPVIIRPDLIIHDMTEAQKNNPGTLAQYYKGTVIQLIGYTEELESALDEYRKISDELSENVEIIDGQVIIDIPSAD